MGPRAGLCATLTASLQQGPSEVLPTGDEDENFAVVAEDTTSARIGFVTSALAYEAARRRGDVTELSDLIAGLTEVGDIAVLQRY